MVVRRNDALWFALLAMMCVELVVRFQLLGPPPQPADAPLDTFSAARAFVVLQRLLGDQSPHPTGSQANDRVRERLVAELSDLGLDVEIQQTRRGPDRWDILSNVLARLPGTPSRGKPLVLATHYDSVAAGPGAADAGACVAALLETARALKYSGAYQRPVYFLISDGEEAGLLGASAFVAAHPLAKDKPVVINFEARGTSGPSLMYETHRGNLSMIRWLARQLPVPCATGSSFVTVYRYLPNDTDFTVYQRDGWTGLNFAFIGGAHRYHTAQDRLENLSLRSLQHHGENALALAHAMASDEAADLEASSQDAVFFDVLGMFVVYYPQTWALPLAVAALVALVLRFVRQLWGRGSLVCALRLITTMVVALIAAAALGGLAAKGLQAAGVLWKGHIALGGLVSSLYLLISATSVWFAARYLLRGMDRGVTWSVFWILWAVLGVVLATLIPGFSYFLLVPTIATVLVSLFPLGLHGRIVWSVLLASVMLLPLANLLPVALGPRAGLVLGGVFSLVLFPLLPFFTALEGGKKSLVRPAPVADTPEVAR